MKFSLSALAFAVVLPLSALAQASNDDPTGKEIYITSPSCGYYKCKVTWKQGSTQTITWLNAPKGGLKIQLVPEAGKSGKTCEWEIGFQDGRTQSWRSDLSTCFIPNSDTVTDHVGSVHEQSQCKSQSNGEKCGT